ncbi:hypothetical protein SEA_JUMBO_61 [Gordonia phage Jumbo]|uniref:Uncharacterized protein n=1 Tax=Gordonia phage Jumbo TaxID=1887650 RepID=A0A1B3B0P9_9CAUD|nr:hypothetical protein BIZ69_gp061 [Gordonia phage Jumbo]AOE44569.1 hypothetical protein SEA_JUMBO_61 [Gordonia phage Jumbo]
MGMGQLGTFEPTSQIEGDRLKAKDVAAAAHPLLINIVDKRENMKTQYSPAGDGKAIYVDILDLTTQEVFIHVMWMNDIVWDNLNNHVGETLPVRLRMKKNKAQTAEYIVVEPLSDEEIAVAQQWVDAKPNLFDDTRREREIPTAEQIRAGVTSVSGGTADSGISNISQSAAAPTPPPAAPTAPPAPPAPAATETPAAPAAPAAPATETPAPPTVNKGMPF